MIRNDERRQLFLYTVLQGNIKDFGIRKRMKYRQAQKAFEGLVQEIKSQAGFLRTYKEENIRLKATVRAYEMKFRQNGFDNDMFMREAEETNPEIFIPEDIKAAKALLDTPITELKFDIRSQRIISEADIKHFGNCYKSLLNMGLGSCVICYGISGWFHKRKWKNA